MEITINTTTNEATVVRYDGTIEKGTFIGYIENRERVGRYLKYVEYVVIIFSYPSADGIYQARESYKSNKCKFVS